MYRKQAYTLKCLDFTENITRTRKDWQPLGDQLYYTRNRLLQPSLCRRRGADRFPRVEQRG